MRHYFFLVILFLGFIQCKESENSANLDTSAQNSIQHAEGFSIEKYDTFTGGINHHYHFTSEIAHFYFLALHIQGREIIKILRNGINRIQTVIFFSFTIFFSGCATGYYQG